MSETTWEIPEDLERCPTCGKFVSGSEGFTDVEPGGTRGSDLCAAYCDARCAARMDPPARCEDHERAYCRECFPEEAELRAKDPRSTIR